MHTPRARPSRSPSPGRGRASILLRLTNAPLRSNATPAAGRLPLSANHAARAVFSGLPVEPPPAVTHSPTPSCRRAFASTAAASFSGRLRNKRESDKSSDRLRDYSLAGYALIEAQVSVCVSVCMCKTMRHWRLCQAAVFYGTGY